MAQVKILVIEDDKDLNMQLKTYLEKQGYQVASCDNGLDGLKTLEDNKFHLILSDIMMPLCDGFEFLKAVRSYDQETPIIFMSARDDKPSKEFGYRLGIDDYIIKPFDLEELVYKINAIIRRLKINWQKEISLGNFTINEEERTAFINGDELPLTVREFNILFFMLANPKKTFTRSKLMEDFWDFDSSATSRTVDVYMAKLREKTKDCDGFEIQTVHGLGYKVVLK